MEWKSLDRYLDIECNEKGKIRFIESKEELQIKKAGRGYYYTNYKDSNNKHTTVLPNIFIATCFLPNPNKCKFVKFKNGIKNDFRVKNLYWANNSMTQYFGIIEDEEIEERSDDEEIVELSDDDESDDEDNLENNNVNIEIYKKIPSHEHIEINCEGVIRLVETKTPYKHIWYEKSECRWLVKCDKKKYRIHRLIAALFLPNPLKKTRIKFINGNPHNFKSSNLQWY